MQILTQKTMYLLEMGIDFVECDLVQGRFGKYLNDDFKKKFMEKNGFDSITQQFAMYKGKDGMFYMQIEVKKIL